MALDDDDDDGRPSARPESLEIACETRPICRHNPTRKRFSTKQKKNSVKLGKIGLHPDRNSPFIVKKTQIKLGKIR